MKRLIAGVTVALVLATPASAGGAPDAVWDDRIACGAGGGTAGVFITREYRWDGKVKLWDGKPFVRDNLRRAVTYRDVLRFSDERGRILIGELSEGRHRLRATYRGEVLDRQRVRVDCA
jgi:hypothetical protein